MAVLVVTAPVARIATADDEPPPRPPIAIVPTEPVPPPPPAPPSPYVWSVSLGLGDVALDQSASGCVGCTGSPAIGTYGAFGMRVGPGAIGVQVQAQVEFVSGHPGDDARAVLFTGFVYGQLDLAAPLQIVGGLGYGSAHYEYSVQHDSLFGTYSESMSDPIGNGPAILGAIRYRVAEMARFELALELRATAVRLDNAGMTPGMSFDVVAGRF